MTTEFDVIISGAGPAGSTAALALGSSGLKVALIDKEMFPRAKVCGDAIPAYVPKVLNTINPLYASAFSKISEKTRVNVCRIVAPSGKSLDLRFREDGYICKREVFDAFLSALAGKIPDLTFLQNTLVKDVRADENEVIIETDQNHSLKARLVIGCDGANSLIKKKLAHTAFDMRECSVAVRTYFKNIKDVPLQTCELHFTKNLLPGYFWIFPLPGNLFNVGLGMSSKAISGKKINLRQELMRIIEDDTCLGRRFKGAEITGEIQGHALPLYSRKIPISGERFMLCGDAASLINPATGAGIGQAMQSGRYAGWHALKCFEKNDFSDDFIKGYHKIVYDKILKVNIRYLMIREFVLKYPSGINGIINAGSKSKKFYETIMKILK